MQLCCTKRSKFGFAEAGIVAALVPQDYLEKYWIVSRNAAFVCMRRMGGYDAGRLTMPSFRV